MLMMFSHCCSFISTKGDQFVSHVFGDDIILAALSSRTTGSNH